MEHAFRTYRTGREIAARNARVAAQCPIGRRKFVKAWQSSGLTYNVHGLGSEILTPVAEASILHGNPPVLLSAMR